MTEVAIPVIPFNRRLNIPPPQPKPQPGRSAQREATNTEELCRMDPSFAREIARQWREFDAALDAAIAEAA
jgi:hypothetical protein